MEVTINRINVHYSCLTKAFAMFVNDKEMNASKSNIIKKFSGISSLSDFVKLGLPIRNISFNGSIVEIPSIEAFLEDRKEKLKLNAVENIEDL